MKEFHAEQVQTAQGERITTTLGDLIATISEIALQAGRTEQEGYHLASLALKNILKKRTQRPGATIILN
jgi:hypothetical protein